MAREGARRGQRRPEGGRAERGAVPAAAARGGAGAPGRQAGPWLLERPVWSPGTRGGGPGIPSRAAKPGQLPDAAGDWPAPPGPHLGPRCGRAASRLHTAPRRGNGWNSSRGASLGLGGGEGARGTCAGAAGRGAGCGCSQPRASAGDPLPGSTQDPPQTPPASPASWPPNLALAPARFRPPPEERYAFLLIRHRAFSRRVGAEHPQHAWAPA